MKQKWLLTGTALLLAAALAGCGNTPAADQTAKISMEQAQTAALDAANIAAADADISSATLSEVAGVTCYKVEFTSGDHTYAYSISAENGEVLEASYRDKNAAPADSTQTDTTTASGVTTTPAQTAPNTNTSIGAVDEAKAQEIALAHAGIKAADATITKSKLDYDDGRQIYEIEWYANGAKYDYEIAVATGEIVNSGYKAKTVVGTGNSAPSARRQQSRPPLPVCPARRLRISTSSSWTLTMAAGSTKARSAMARWSTTSPSTPIPVRSSNGTWNPSTTKQITNVRFFFFYSTRHYSTSSISISGVAPYFPTR